MAVAFLRGPRVTERQFLVLLWAKKDPAAAVVYWLDCVSPSLVQRESEPGAGRRENELIRGSEGC